MPTSRRVLIIDDDPDIRAAIADVLSEDGHAVDEAGDGLEGLARARQQRPDVILLDLMMPRMDGWTFRNVQQSDPVIADTPVIVMSACLPDEIRSIDALAHLQKPFRLADLVAIVGTRVPLAPACAPACPTRPRGGRAGRNPGHGPADARVRDAA